MPKKREPKYDASRGAIRLGFRDVGFDPVRGFVMDSGSSRPHRDDFRSVQEQISDGDLDVLALTALAQNYEANGKRFVEYRD